MNAVRFYSYNPSLTNVFKQTMSSIGSQAMILTSGIRIAPSSIKQESTINSSITHGVLPGDIKTYRAPTDGILAPLTALLPGNTQLPPTDTTIHNLHGMTLGSVTSLSVVPKCLLQFNLHLPSYTSHALHSCGYLALHILPPIANSVKLGRMFAKGVKYDTVKGEEKLLTTEQELVDGQVFHEMTTPFSQLAQSEWRFKHVVDDIQVPILNETETVFICKTEKSFAVDNHEIWIVTVLQIIQNKDYPLSGGLLYFNRGFHKIGGNLHE